MATEELNKCVSGSELAELIEQAFVTWQGGARGRRSGSHRHDRRRTPRVDVLSGKYLYIIGYRFEGKDFTVDRPARLVNMSADGLGIEVDQEVPVGAQMCFSFRNDRDRDGTGFGWARVANMQSGDRGFKIGLDFDEDARSLDPEATDDLDVGFGLLVNTLATWVHGFKLGLRKGLEVLARRCEARRELTREVDGKTARFVVDVKLSRYHASLFVDGRRVVSQSGVLLDRLLNLWTDAALPTMIHLEGEGFSAWATMRPHKVLRSSLDLSVAGLENRCRRLVFGTRAAGHADGQGENGFADRAKPDGADTSS